MALTIVFIAVIVPVSAAIFVAVPVVLLVMLPILVMVPVSILVGMRAMSISWDRYRDSENKNQGQSDSKAEFHVSSSFLQQVLRAVAVPLMPESG